MKNSFFIMSFFLFALGASFGQTPSTGNPDFDAELGRLLTDEVPFISVNELRENLNKVIILDAREAEEYAVSHIPGARYIGYQNFEKSEVDGIEKDTPIVLYCSVGYRSGKVGEKLQRMGFTNVRNLYGSIFEWANEGLPLENIKGEPTKEVHTYSEKWSQWVDNPEVKKVW